MQAMASKPEWFQVKVLELLFESDRRDRVPVDRISSAIYDCLLRRGAGTRCGNRPVRAPKVCPYPDRDTEQHESLCDGMEQHESLCDGMASLLFGPALKAGKGALL
eukprot:3859200-Rhodomonas_salina.1